MPRMDSINRRRPGCKEKELIFGTWNVRTLFRTGALLSLLSQLKEYRLAITALQKTRWRQGKAIMDMKSQTFLQWQRKGSQRIWGGICSWKENETECAWFNPLNAELNPICYLLALLGAHHFLHVSRIRVKSLTLRLLMSYIYIWH